MHFNDSEESACRHRIRSGWGGVKWKSHKSLLFSITWPLWVQTMFAGGVGLWETMQVRLMVEPVSMNISGDPMIVVIGSVCMTREILSSSWGEVQVILIKWSLTDNWEDHSDSDGRRRTNLALVDPGVTFLREENLRRRRSFFFKKDTKRTK